MKRLAQVITKVELWKTVIFVTYKNAPARFVSYRTVPSFLIRPLVTCHRIYHSFTELELNLATQEAARRFNEYKQIFAMCRRMGWSWSCDEFGYVIEGIYTSGWSHNLAGYIADQLFKPLAA